MMPTPGFYKHTGKVDLTDAEPCGGQCIGDARDEDGRPMTFFCLKCATHVLPEFVQAGEVKDVKPEETKPEETKPEETKPRPPASAERSSAVQFVVGALAGLTFAMMKAEGLMPKSVREMVEHTINTEAKRICSDRSDPAAFLRAKLLAVNAMSTVLYDFRAKLKDELDRLS